MNSGYGGNVKWRDVGVWGLWGDQEGRGGSKYFLS